MRLARLGKAIEATGGAHNSNATNKDNNALATATSPKARTNSKARGSRAEKRKNRKAENMILHEDGAKDEEETEPKPRGKKPKLSSVGIKAEEEEAEEDINDYDNGGTADHDYKVVGI